MQKVKKIEKAIALLSAIRLIPHMILFNIHPRRKIIKYEIERWFTCLGIAAKGQYGFIHLMTFYPEFRNLFYYRIGAVSGFVRWLCPKMNTLFFNTKDTIGPGLFIQHGFATSIGAKSIGKDCWICQQVTIGYAKTGAPEIGDHVTIHAGAIIVGKLHLGDHSQVGVNSVVIKDVPENCTVFGVPARIVREDKTEEQ